MNGPFKDLERHAKVPRYFIVFFLALAAWGIAYIALYTPGISGWSQREAFRKEREAESRAVPAASTRENPYEDDSKAVAEGKGIYEENCAGCHGANLKGDAGPDLTGPLSYGDSDDRMFASVAEGRPGGMPAFGTQLGKERIWRLLAYVDAVRERGEKP